MQINGMNLVFTVKPDAQALPRVAGLSFGQSQRGVTPFHLWRSAPFQRYKRVVPLFLSHPQLGDVMTLCPIALMATCNKCFAVSVCPLKTTIGDYKPDESAGKETKVAPSDKPHS